MKPHFPNTVPPPKVCQAKYSNVPFLPRKGSLYALGSKMGTDTNGTDLVSFSIFHLQLSPPAALVA